MLGALLAVAIPILENPEALQLHGGARAYFESGYISSSGRLTYTKPVAEQTAYLQVRHEDFGWLMTLAAGSLVFFGTSALARRVWHLDRTAMAFYAIGSAFLPLSVWAAGYMHLLGDGLCVGKTPGRRDVS